MTLDAIDIIDLLPREIAEALIADPFFADIPVVVADEGDVTAMIAEKRAALTKRGGKVGVAVVVLEVEADDPGNGNNYGPMLLKPSIQVVEQVALNKSKEGTGKSAAKVARRIRDTLKLFTPAGLTKNLLADNPCILPVTLEAKGYKGRQVNFTALEDDTQALTKVATPIIAPSSGAVPQNVTIACATAGADIYYTLDGTHPRPTALENPSTAVLYAGAIPIAAACLLRARAFPGSSSATFASNTSIAKFTS